MEDNDQNKDIGVYISKNLNTLYYVANYWNSCSYHSNQSRNTAIAKRQNKILFDAIQLYTGNNSLEKRSERYYNGKTVYPELKSFKVDPSNKIKPSTDPTIIKDPLEKFWKDYHSYANEVNFMYNYRDEFVEIQKKRSENLFKSEYNPHTQLDIGDGTCADNIIKIHFEIRFYILEILRHQIIIEHKKRNYSTFSNEYLYYIFFWFCNSKIDKKDKNGPGLPRGIYFKGGPYLMNVKVLLQHLDNMFMNTDKYIEHSTNYIDRRQDIIEGISLDVDPDSKGFLKVFTYVSYGPLGVKYTSKYKKNIKSGILQPIDNDEEFYYNKYDTKKFEYLEFTAAIWSVLDLNDNTEKYLFTDYLDPRNTFRNFGDKIKVLSNEKDITKEEFEDFVKRINPKLTSLQTNKKSLFNRNTGNARSSTITNGTPATGGKKSKKEKYGKKKTKKLRSPKNKTRKMR